MKQSTIEDGINSLLKQFVKPVAKMIADVLGDDEVPEPHGPRIVRSFAGTVAACSTADYKYVEIVPLSSYPYMPEGTKVTVMIHDPQ